MNKLQYIHIQSPKKIQKKFFGLYSRVFRVLVNLLCRVEVIGAEKVPDHGPIIVAVNHLNFLDPVLVMLALPYDYITVLVAEKWGEIWPVNWIVASAGGVFVRRGEVDRAALNRCLAALKTGGVVGLAPEGTRSRTGVMQRGKPGVAYIALKANAVILPIGISGSETITRCWRRLCRPRITVRVGSTFSLKPLEGKNRAEQLQARSDEIMCRIAALVRQDLRGVYDENTCNVGSAP
jgi:1-acyl-sn-glycerol-3-phosphate acyltransferase